MVSIHAVNELRAANRQLASLVDAEIADLFVMIGDSSPFDAQQVLMQVLPELVNEYGEIAQATAAEWYESTYRQRAYLLDRGTPVKAIASNVGYQVGWMLTAGVPSRMSNIQSSMVRHVRNQGRETIMQSATHNGGRWARIPTSGKPCAFCLMLASRDAVYLSEETARVASRTGEDYHDDCWCEAVQLNSWDEYPEGYDPKAMYSIYNAAAKSVGNRTDYNSITYTMRRQHPDLVRDGVFED